ncbi:MAG: type II toxin-antitoxin system ParD family antitoxin [Stellaceae bacterium]
METRMPTRNLVLTAHHESVVRALVRSGRYQNASEVLREGMRLVEALKACEAARLRALQEAARTGLADLAEGRAREFESVDDLADYLHDVSERTLAAPTEKEDR